ncbi:MAG: methionine adenosyltransferase [Gemmatimonadota bacterium]|nr:methionine adenosyltransferase [Gemmatimonadota bacterium]MDE3005109.1 methionine adenosyltransferase [Gemmatimonadota bacterium]MDE3013481.1 methionine adenosyltransferase [Gemmatimonadota bacterium]
MSTTLFTSESVTEGHPDKIADQISDSVLDHMLAQDASSRVACETLVTTGLALIAGEVTTSGYVHLPDVVRGTLQRIGYTNSAYGIDGTTCSVLTSLDRQSPHIAMGVDTGGAGDQGMMFGYASDETPEYMPPTIHYAHALTRQLAKVRRSGELPWVRPDGKSQVTIEFDGDTPVRIHTVVVSTQHDEDVSQDEIVHGIAEKVVKPALPSSLYDPDDCILHVNPTGRFVIGGPHGDAGLTGRKIIVDTYGGVGRHGGGAFSGKDATKVDRSAAYASRWAAKNVVAAGLARRCEIQLAYAIGVAEPVSVHVTTFGTSELPEDVLSRAVAEVFDFRPAAIIEALGLRNPIFTATAAYGHFGRTPETKIPDCSETGEAVRFFPWEDTNRIDDLKTAAGA